MLKEAIYHEHNQVQFYPLKMEQNHSVQTTSHQVPSVNEIPLVSFLKFENHKN